MSYQVLARKWRPRNFQEVVGQQHVLTALSNGLAQNRVHHAYLFSGTRGVGKTTIARILAKSLNCEKGVTATPCGKCVNCKAIDEGRFVDLLEIDAASRTKVDDTRELLDNVQYKPAQGRYKVYLIDEVHMLSKHSFNALLKTLEEPPEYVKFLLATTDPQKLPITVLSRCLQFHLKAILPEQIEKQLSLILSHEKATFESGALTVIAKAANGSMRDALSLTDQALAFGSGNIEYQAVLKMLGTIDNSHLYYLLHFIASGNVEKVFQKIEEFVHLGADFAKLHQELATLCHHIALLQMRNRGKVSGKSPIELLGERLTPEEVQLFYQIALQGYKDYVFAPNGKIAFEMTVMRLLAFKPASYITLDENLLGTCAAVEQAPPAGATPVLSEAVTATQQPVNIATTAPVIQKNEAEQLNVAATPVIQKNEAEQLNVPVAPVSQKNEAEQLNVAVAPVSQENETEQLNVPVAPVNQEKESEQLNAPATPANVEPSPDQELQPESITHSRNMLRSHRLKIEQAKKLQATTVKQIPGTVVADLPVDIASPTVAKVPNTNNAPNKVPPVVAEQAHVEQEHVVLVPVTHKIKTDSVPVEQELPPIDSYLQDNFNDPGDVDLDEPAFIPEKRVQALNSVTEPVLKRVEGQATQEKPLFFSDEQLEVASVDVASYVADKITDQWSLVIQKMQLMGLVKVLAKNCVMKQIEQQIILTLKVDQQHLLNNSRICEQLQDKLKAYFGEQISMYIEVGEVAGQLTPIEGEHDIYQQYLERAKQNIIEDQNIQTWVANYGAKIYENTIIPL